MLFRRFIGEMKIKGDKYLQEKFRQYQSGALSDLEKEIIDNWFSERITDKPLAHGPQSELRLAVYSGIQQRIRKQDKKRYPLGWLKIACLLFLISGTSVFTLRKLKETKQPKQQSVQVFSTVNGQNKKITLQDGTQIWLNSATRLCVDAGFTNSRLRKVYLEHGEAFFQVKRDTLRPFKIITQRFVTTVLGTSFNIKSYPELHTYTVAVASGKVKVAYQNKLLAQELTPNKVLTYTLLNRKKTISKQDVSLLSGWRLNGSVYLENLTLSQIGAALSRQYNMEVKINHPANDKKTYTLYLANQPIQQAVQRIALQTGMNYQLTRHTLTLNPNPF